MQYELQLKCMDDVTRNEEYHHEKLEITLVRRKGDLVQQFCEKEGLTTFTSENSCTNNKCKKDYIKGLLSASPWETWKK